MKKIFIPLLLVVCLLGGLHATTYNYETVPNDPMKARIYTLPNGLKVYLTQNAEKPEIQTYIAVRAGSQNDPEESTGLAHYLEHVMFKGTTNYGTTNFTLEKPNLDAIDSLYELYSHTTDTDVRKAIYHQIDSISYVSSTIAIANEFDKLMDGIGASGVNAFTSNEMTCYHEVIPAGELSRWAAIESDRFQNLIIRGFHTELEAVYEEFNMYSTQDQDKIMLAIDQLLFPELPYRQHTVIGTQEHLKNPSLLNVKKFYNNYYRPNNVAICLSGDLDFDRTIAIIDHYFGAWNPNKNLAPLPEYQLSNITTPKDTTIYGTESPAVWLAWRFPGAAEKDAEVVELLSKVLMNGMCGILDLNVNQKQRLLGCFAFPYESNDYTTFYLIGMPKEGQELADARSILLAELDKLKSGDFSDDLLKAIIANQKLEDMQALQSNDNRAMQMVSSFIYGIPWSNVVTKLDRQSKITKEDIVRVANKYFTDGYACVFKLQGEDSSIVKVDKPAISPIEMNRDKSSHFRDSLLALNSEPLQPQFVDFKKDLTLGNLNGREIIYRQNNENDIFQLQFITNGGSKQDPALSMAEDYVTYLGTSTMSAEELQTKLYALACEVSVDVNEDRTYFSVSGLQENLPAALQLLEEWVLTANADNDIYNELVADAIRSHEDQKSDQRASFGHLRVYGTYGVNAIRQQTLTPEQMKAIKPQALLKRLSQLALNTSKVIYYGPAAYNDVEQVIKGSKFLQKGIASSKMMHTRTLPVKKSEVLVAPFDAQNIYFLGFAEWGEVYNPKDEAIIRLFNEYFNGSMGSVVFQEMRESRALAYSASARFNTPAYKGDDYNFNTFIISQNDKLKDCIEAFDSICTYMPISASAFEQAKASLLKSIEQRRYTRTAPIQAYLRFEQLGWDHDWNKDIYEEVKHLTIDDVVRFQKSHVASRTYRYMILGNPEQLDMDYLKTLGPVKLLTTKDIFIY